MMMAVLREYSQSGYLLLALCVLNAILYPNKKGVFKKKKNADQFFSIGANQIFFIPSSFTRSVSFFHLSLYSTQYPHPSSLISPPFNQITTATTIKPHFSEPHISLNSTSHNPLNPISHLIPRMHPHRYNAIS